MDSFRILPEDLCWEIASLDHADGDLPGLPEEILEAYRAKLLSADESSRLERWLAGNQAARRDLAALGGVEVPAPPAELRERVLAALCPPRHASACVGGGAPTLSSLPVKP